MYNPKMIGKCSLCEGPVVTSANGIICVCMYCHAVGNPIDVLYKSLPTIDMIRPKQVVYKNEPTEYYCG